MSVKNIGPFLIYLSVVPVISIGRDQHFKQICTQKNTDLITVFINYSSQTVKQAHIQRKYG